MSVRRPYALPACLTLLWALILLSPLAAQDGAMKDSSMMKHGEMGMDQRSHDHPMAPHGTFTGANGHAVSGGYELVEADGKQWLMLAEDFALDKAPDPYVVLSPSERGADPRSLNLGRLRNHRGAQRYPIPAGTDVSGFTHVIIWCKKYNVTLGSSDLAMQDEMMHH